MGASVDARVVVWLAAVLLLLDLSAAYTGDRFAGITFTNGKYCPNVTFDSADADLSLFNLYTTGANAVAVVVTQYQDRFDSTEIYPIWTPQHAPGAYYTYLTASDNALRHVIQTAHELGLKVLLKPHIDLTQDDEHWRGDIGAGFSDEQWEAWFASYSEFLLHYATLAEQTGVELFSLSCELITASKRDADWRKLAAQVRTVFHGALTDAANWGYLNATGGEETNKTWWDVVDYIGVDAYYPILPGDPHPTLERALAAWQPVLQRLHNLTVAHGRPVLVTEIGYCSPDCQRHAPGPADPRFQAVLYEAALRSLWADRAASSWLAGVFWWAWNTDPRFGGAADRCISPQWKPAQQLLRQYYDGEQRPLPVRPTGDPVCLCTV